MIYFPHWLNIWAIFESILPTAQFWVFTLQVRSQRFYLQFGLAVWCVTSYPVILWLHDILNGHCFFGGRGCCLPSSPCSTLFLSVRSIQPFFYWAPFIGVHWREPQESSEASVTTRMTSVLAPLDKSWTFNGHILYSRQWYSGSHMQGVCCFLGFEPASADGPHPTSYICCALTWADTCSHMHS